MIDMKFIYIMQKIYRNLQKHPEIYPKKRHTSLANLGRQIKTKQVPHTVDNTCLVISYSLI